MHVKSLTTFAVVCLTLSTQTWAETLIVPEKYSTIQEAINAADNGDTVVVKPGIYHGAGNRDISFGGKTITVKSEQGPERTILDCASNNLNEPHSGFIFNKGESAQSVLEGITVMHGQALSEHGYKGGAVYIFQSSPTIRNCVFIRNKAKDKGGAMALEESEARIEDCIFRQNEANQGGGVYLENSMGATFDRTLISENDAQTQGGGISVSGGALKMSNSTIRQNWAKQGAGIHSQEAAVFLTNVAANQNIAYTHAALVFEGDSMNTIRLVNTTIADNFGQNGGAIFYGAPRVPLHDPFSQPTRAESGVAPHESSGAKTDGEGLQTLSVENSILWNNFPFGMEDTTGFLRVRYSNIEEGWMGEGNIQEDPLFTDPKENDFSLHHFSPAIDAADGDKAPPWDAAGLVRYDDKSVANTGSGRVNYADMGAYERQEDSRQINLGHK